MSTKTFPLALVPLSIIVTTAIFGCAATQSNLSNSRGDNVSDENTMDMTGLWDIHVVSRNGRFNLKMDLKQQGRQIKGTLFLQAWDRYPISGIINGNEFKLKSEVHYGPSAGFILKFDGHIDDHKAIGKTYFGPRWVPWNMNWISRNYDKISRGKFTAQRQQQKTKTEF